MADYLRGFRVVEASSYVSGPFAGLMLSDLGADVVKVEPPPNGDPFRNFGRRVEGAGVAFANLNRGKHSVLCDLKTKEGVTSLHRLLDSADVFVTNWRPGVAEEMELTGEVVSERHPRLVWIRISGYGQDGPLSRRPAFDQLLQARTGLAILQGLGTPELVRAFFADKVTAMYTVQSALAALHEREETGAGAIIDLAMLDAVAYFNFPDLLVNQSVVGLTDPGGVQATAARPIETSDGWVVVSPVSGRQIRSAFDAVGHSEWVAQLKVITDPFEMARTMLDLLESRTRDRTSAEWERVFAEHDVPCSRVLNVQEHLDDPQVIHNELYQELDDPVMGAMRRVRYPAVLNGIPDSVAGPPAPMVGQFA